MDNQSNSFIVTACHRRASGYAIHVLNVGYILQFIPGQVAILSKEGGGESYFAIASAPEDRGVMDFLIRNGEGTSGIIFSARLGGHVNGKGPIGYGFPIDLYHGRDLFLSAVGSAIAPLRSAMRSVDHRRAAFGKLVPVYGVRHAEEIPLVDEIRERRTNRIDVTLTVSRRIDGFLQHKIRKCEKWRNT